MRRQDFSYDLPSDLIAHEPTLDRTGSRLLHLDGMSGALLDRQFMDICQLARPGDLMVFNNTEVIPARLFATKTTGGKVEILVERVLSVEQGNIAQNQVLAHVKASKAPKSGAELVLNDEREVVVVGRQGALFLLQFPSNPFHVLEALGHMPLPPYIERDDTIADKARYQTVYAQHKGAVAAPTAGLHFTESVIDQLKLMGVGVGFVTLHVGAGTFQPVRADDIHQHVMHSEWASVPQETCDQIAETRERGGRVIAVGTTSVRSLESAADGEGNIYPYHSDTDIFIYPGYQFRVVDALVTNFHLPESTLMMLVSAFAGYTNIMRAYEHAIEERYRFFSYGDAMFIEKNALAGAVLPGN